MLCHWPGMYTHGTKQGFAALQRVILALNRNRADQIIWMKLNEIARYWAAKELTRAKVADGGVSLSAPFACPQFTIRIPGPASGPPTIVAGTRQLTLRQVSTPRQLESGTWLSESESNVLCFDLPKGKSMVRISAP